MNFGVICFFHSSSQLQCSTVISEQSTWTIRRLNNTSVLSVVCFSLTKTAHEIPWTQPQRLIATWTGSVTIANHEIKIRFWTDFSVVIKAKQLHNLVLCHCAMFWFSYCYFLLSDISIAYCISLPFSNGYIIPTI